MADEKALSNVLNAPSEAAAKAAIAPPRGEFPVPTTPDHSILNNTCRNSLITIGLLIGSPARTG